MNAAHMDDIKLSQVIGHIAGILSHDGFPAGERAQLRRMNLDHAPPLAFYRFALRHLPPNWDQGDAVRRNWMTLVAGIALMSPKAHRLERRLGLALAEARFSESRLERLLAATGDTRRVLVLRAARFLAAKNDSCNWVEMAQLVLTQSADGIETINRRVAKDFYGADQFSD